MATKTVKVSDLSGTEIRDETQLARLVVEDHPDISDSVTLEVLPEEIEGQLPEEQNYVRVTYFPPSGSGGDQRTLVLSIEEFNALSEFDMEQVLTAAQRAEQEQDGRRRGRRGRRGAGERKQRIDYASPEHAGLPHRGRVTDAEREYVRSNLDAVNERRVQAGHDPIDLTDPKQAEKYGLSEPPSDEFNVGAGSA